MGVLIEPVGQLHLNCYVEVSFLLLVVYFEFFVTRSLFRVLTATFRNAMPLGGARTPTTCSIESSCRFWCFVYISNHWMPCLCLGAILMSTKFRRLVFLRSIVVFLNDNQTNLGVSSFMEESYQNIVSFVVEKLSRLSHDCPQLLSNQVFEMAFSVLSETSFTSCDTEIKLMNFLGT